MRIVVGTGIPFTAAVSDFSTASRSQACSVSGRKTDYIEVPAAKPRQSVDPATTRLAPPRLEPPAQVLPSNQAQARLRAFEMICERLRCSREQTNWALADEVDAYRQTLELACAAGDEAAIGAVLQSGIATTARCSEAYATELALAFLAQRIAVNDWLDTPVTQARAEGWVRNAGGSGVVLARYLNSQLACLCAQNRALLQELNTITLLNGAPALSASLVNTVKRQDQALAALLYQFNFEVQPNGLPVRDIDVYAADEEGNAWARRAAVGAAIGARSLPEAISWALASAAGGRLRHVRLIGHALPGEMRAGDFSRGERLLVFPLRLSEVIEVLRLAPFFVEDSLLILGGCEVAADERGAALLATLAVVLGVVTKGSADIQQQTFAPLSWTIAQPGEQGRVRSCEPKDGVGVCDEGDFDARP